MSSKILKLDDSKFFGWFRGPFVALCLRTSLPKGFSGDVEQALAAFNAAVKAWRQDLGGGFILGVRYGARQLMRHVGDATICTGFEVIFDTEARSTDQALEILLKRTGLPDLHLGPQAHLEHRGPHADRAQQATPRCGRADGRCS